MRFEGIKHTDHVILMKVTSRERPDRLLSTVKTYIDLAANTFNMCWLFSFDEDDHLYSTKEFRQKISDLIKPGKDQACYVFYQKSKSKIDAINRDINDIISPWDILLNISDDQIPVTKGYDDVIRRNMPDDLDGYLWFNDGWQDRINTQEIIGRTYYERFKYVYHSSYKSFFCDNENTEVAGKLGKLKYFNYCLIRHEHPQWNPQINLMDDLYKKNNVFWNYDKSNFMKRKIEGFPI